jgi:hypothetical protein
LRDAPDVVDANEMAVDEFLYGLDDTHLLDTAGGVAGLHELDGDGASVLVAGLPDLGKAAASPELQEFQSGEGLTPHFQANAAHD